MTALVSEHAAVRFLERCMLIEDPDQALVDKARAEIVRRHGDILTKAAAIKAHSIRLDGFVYCIANGTVTTILQKDKPSRTGVTIGWRLAHGQGGAR